MRLSRHEHPARFQHEHVARLFVVQPRVYLEANADLAGVELAQDAREAALCAVKLGRNDAVPRGEGLRERWVEEEGGG